MYRDWRAGIWGSSWLVCRNSSDHKKVERWCSLKPNPPLGVHTIHVHTTLFQWGRLKRTPLFQIFLCKRRTLIEKAKLFHKKLNWIFKPARLLACYRYLSDESAKNMPPSNRSSSWSFARYGRWGPTRNKGEFFFQKVSFPPLWKENRLPTCRKNTNADFNISKLSRTAHPLTHLKASCGKSS